MTLRLQTYLIFGLTVVTAGASSLAWHQYQELIDLRARVDRDGRRALEQRMAELKAQNTALLSRLAARQDATKPAGPGTGDADGNSTDGATTTAATLATLAQLPGDSRKEAELDVLAALADLPEFQQLIALQQRGAIDGKYAALFRKLHLSPEQQQQLEGMLASKQSAFADALLAARDQGLNGREARMTAKAIAQATNKEIDANIKSMLGEQGYQQLQNYERTMPQRETVNQLAQRLGYTNTPLTPHQQDQLVQALATGARQDLAALRAQAAATGQPVARPPTTMNALPNGLSGLGVSGSSGAVITASGVTKAQSILSTQQLSTLQQLQQEQQAQLTLGKLLRTGAAKPAAPAKPVPTVPAPVVTKNGNG